MKIRKTDEGVILQGCFHHKESILLTDAEVLKLLYFSQPNQVPPSKDTNHPKIAMTREIASIIAREFMGSRNPEKWNGYGPLPETVRLDALSFPINDVYAGQTLRIQLYRIGAYNTHMVCVCNIHGENNNLRDSEDVFTDSASSKEELIQAIFKASEKYEEKLEKGKMHEHCYARHI